MAIAAFAVISKNAFFLDLTFAALLFAVLGQAWNWISGYAGQVSFGHALFFGCGAYGSALANWHHLSPWIGVLWGVAAAAVIALIVGFPCFALRGHYFSIATIAVAAIGEIYAKNANWLNGAVGIELTLAPPGLGNLQFTDKTPWVLIALVVFAAVQGATMLLAGSRMGYYLRAIRANQEAAASVGIDARAWKLRALIASAIAAALGGSLYAQYNLVVEPESILSISVSISIALVGVVGGLGQLWGPALGALTYAFPAKYVAAQLGGTGRGLDLVIYGGLICVIAALRPSGLAGLIALLFHRRPAFEQVHAEEIPS
ncbi:MAG: branched-chain amino acid ABC transporter permease [Candidatus Eremiobacteraeota bacterium]|nr:branched-chain amino acid ABC transporter permease [Candidatus Eremiobacteraeota bacterium]